MNRIIHACLWLIAIQAVVAVGLTVLNVVRVFDTHYWVAVMLTTIAIVRIHYSLATNILKGYYLNPESYLTVRGTVIITLSNLYSLLLIIIWLWV